MVEEGEDADGVFNRLAGVSQEDAESPEVAVTPGTCQSQDDGTSTSDEVVNLSLEIYELDSQSGSDSSSGENLQLNTASSKRRRIAGIKPPIR
jgi:hypothetical protein